MNEQYRAWMEELTMKLMEIKKIGRGEAETFIHNNRAFIPPFWNANKSVEETAERINFIAWEDDLIACIEGSGESRGDAQGLVDAHADFVKESWHAGKSAVVTANLLVQVAD
ncbi:MAG: hypothetical protein ACTS9Y_00175 [Methylophilus sp.]|uniref:hypothetical protein n=1 Tax=Methylophilus sp. TaxID=29541 RepID=UPI003F9F0D7B